MIDTTHHRDRARHRLDRDTMRVLGRVAPWRLIGKVLVEWASVIAAAGIATWSGHAAVIALAVAFIATRQHALLILMHEFSHHQFSRTRPLWNDAVGDILTALPFFITIHGFRRDHVQHHQHTSTANDPNWVSEMRQDRYRFPKTRLEFVRQLALHACGVYTLRELKAYSIDSRMSIDSPPATRRRQLLFAITVVALASWFHLWGSIALYWLLPLFTGLMALLYLRDIAEHLALPRPGVWASRTVLAGRQERYLLAPHGVNFHTEHHLFPAVPGHRLAAVNTRLNADAQFRRNAVQTRGYLSGLTAEIGGQGTACGVRQAG